MCSCATSLEQVSRITQQSIKPRADRKQRSITPTSSRRPWETYPRVADDEGRCEGTTVGTMVHRMKGRALGLVLAFMVGAAALAGVASVAGWWSRTSTPVILNTVAVERSIEASIRSQRHLASTVACPVNILQEAGVVFECVASIGRRHFPVVVTETDSKGHVAFVVT